MRTFFHSLGQSRPEATPWSITDVRRQSRIRGHQIVSSFEAISSRCHHEDAKRDRKFESPHLRRRGHRLHSFSGSERSGNYSEMQQSHHLERNFNRLSTISRSALRRPVSWEGVTPCVLR